LPAALGAKLALPDKQVVCISGDGSAMWGIQSLWVGARYQIPVTFIILSNGAYRQVRIMKTKIMGEAAKGRDLGTELYPPRIDFCRLAEGMGLQANKVEKPEQLQSTLRQAFDCGQPNLVEVIVDPSF
jgi:benzoylformate decarboxylase